MKEIKTKAHNIPDGAITGQIGARNQTNNEATLSFYTPTEFRAGAEVYGPASDLSADTPVHRAHPQIHPRAAEPGRLQPHSHVKHRQANSDPTAYQTSV